MTRTSQSDPLRVAIVAAADTSGRVGVTLCPGKWQPHAVTGAWARDLDADLQVIADLGATTLVTLVEQHELDDLRVPALPARARALGLTWYHLPVVDGDIPRGATEQRYQDVVGPDLRRRLRAGELVVVHCKGGLGRAGTLAARLLVELGTPPDVAIATVRAARRNAIETARQARFVQGLQPVDD